MKKVLISFGLVLLTNWLSAQSFQSQTKQGNCQTQGSSNTSMQSAQRAEISAQNAAQQKANASGRQETVQQANGGNLGQATCRPQQTQSQPKKP